ncbi:uncharacterized protein BJ171DRAFT_581371 [Polychytrium aggregatum]|uniref:uncharacterized protein n=1 Tax=Polychytrium aggregatum TaxID=110093 RepID=UPI0022FF0DD1|nr:uncharacterized protein BJ171DRAFT_581371 [Polychytrium aggregatum]KAI9205167.1 hypothetical protein BJ171DRAFT_581371 [Polychytrium aggregatum]
MFSSPTRNKGLRGLDVASLSPSPSLEDSPSPKPSRKRKSTAPSITLSSRAPVFHDPWLSPPPPLPPSRFPEWVPGAPKSMSSLSSRFKCPQTTVPRPAADSSASAAKSPLPITASVQRTFRKIASLAHPRRSVPAHASPTSRTSRKAPEFYGRRHEPHRDDIVEGTQSSCASAAHASVPVAADPIADVVSETYPAVDLAPLFRKAQEGAGDEDDENEPILSYQSGASGGPTPKSHRRTKRRLVTPSRSPFLRRSGPRPSAFSATPLQFCSEPDELPLPSATIPPSKYARYSKRLTLVSTPTKRRPPTA